ncbi:MAG: ATP-binding protein, partial [Cellulosimicrobium funkei]
MTPPDDAPLVVLSATASPPWLDALPDAFAALWGQAPWVPADDRLAVELATTEIAANIVRHSPAPETVEVRAELDAGAGRVVVVLRDTAPAADVDLDRTMPPPEAASGRGLALARA